MIKRVRKQFICITMAMLTTVLLVPLVALNVITEAMSYNQTRNLLEQIAITEAESRVDTPHGPIPDQPPENIDPTTPTSTAAATSVETTSTSTITSTDISSDSMTNRMSSTKAVTKTSASSTASPKTEKSIQTSTSVSHETKPIQTTRTTKKAASIVTEKTSERRTESFLEPFPDWPEPDKPEPEPWYPEWRPSHDNMALIQSTYTTLSILRNTAEIQGQFPNDPMLIPTNQMDDKNAIPPKREKREHIVTIDHFLCFADKNGTLKEISGTDAYTQEDGQVFIDYVLHSEKIDGFYENLQFYRKDIPDGTLIVFSDRSADQLLMKKLLIVSILVFLCMEGVVLVLTMLLTKRAMKPMQDTFERQRQFISDAGHELKTPLTIISANVDILQDEIGSNKWLVYIQAQTERMGKLIKDMMNLTKLDMRNQQQEFTSFSLSTAVTNAVLPFESQAFEQKKKLTLEVQENIQYTGNAEQMKQLIAIFTDNAIKYSNANGEIRVTLEQIRDKKILKIYNTGQGVTETEKEKIFERFYRSDSSRSRATGGYGLGLSIAKSIADAHKIKIQVESEYEHWICFTLLF